MAQMIRKQIYIDADNERLLKERSEELVITEAEVVRQALAAARREAVAEVERRVSDETRLKALDDILTHIREHRMGNTSSSEDTRDGWVFNREELYEERMARYGKHPDEVTESHDG